MQTVKFDLKQLDGHWHNVIQEITGVSLDIKPGKPCPICGGKDRFHYTNKYNNGTYICRQCTPEGGTGYKLLSKILNLDNKETFKIIVERYGNFPAKDLFSNSTQLAPNKDSDKLTPIIPSPQPFKCSSDERVTLWDSTGTRKYNYLYSSVWDWFDVDGNIIGAIGRQADKKTHQIYWTEKGWAQGTLGDNRPLFGLQTLKGQENIIVVEGEKAWSSLAENTKKYGVVTWTGGAGAVLKSDWSPLAGKKVYLWPDHDDEGMTAVKKIANVLKNKAGITILSIPLDYPEKWDAADWVDEKYGMFSESELEEFISERSTSTQSDATLDLDATQSAVRELKRQLNPLGWTGERAFFMPLRQGIIRNIPGTLGPEALRSLVRLRYWQAAFPGNGADKVGWSNAIDCVFDWIEGKPYNPSDIRGRGCWNDEGRIVAHLGDKLVVDGVITAIPDLKTKYIYPKNHKILDWTTECLFKRDVDLLEEISDGFRWENPLYSKLLLGWISVAIAGGALKWRPHEWVNGPAGTGKSTIAKDFIGYLLGSFCLKTQGVTTEAGIRHSLKYDCLPVIFDECEGEDQQTLSRLAALLALMRTSSSDNDSKALKGSASGEAHGYNLSSAFILFSIAVGINKKADSDRISNLALKPQERDNIQIEREDKKKWIEIENKITLMAEDLSQRLICHVITRIPKIRESAKVFSKYWGNLDGHDRREGDQFGALVAGYHALRSNEVITEKECNVLINKFNWDANDSFSDGDSHDRALAIIKEHIIDYDSVGFGLKRTTIGAALGSLLNLIHPLKLRELDDLQAKRAQGIREALWMYGIHLYSDCGSIGIRNKNKNLERVFEKHLEFKSWKDFLARLPGAKRGTIVWRNHILDSGNGVRIPIDTFFTGDPSTYEEEKF